MRIGAAAKQFRRERVDPHVRCLGRQHRRDQEFESVGEIQFAARVGEEFGQLPVDAAGPALAGEGGFFRGGVEIGRASRRERVEVCEVDDGVEKNISYSEEESSQTKEKQAAVACHLAIET